MTIADTFLANAARSPDRDAVVLDGTTRGRLSYAGLRRRALGVARALLARFGTDPAHEPWIAVLMGNRPEFLDIFEGAAVAGVPVMVFDPEWSETELTMILTELSPALVLCDHETPVLSRHLPPEAMLEISGAEYRSWTRDDATDFPLFPRVPDLALFYGAFTSGSTGRPKCAVRTHRSWSRTFDRYDAEFGITGEDHVLLPGSLGHSHFLFGAVHALHAGATVHLMSRFGADAVFDRLGREAITVVYLVPTMFEALLDHADRHPDLRFPGVRLLLSVGAKWSPARRARAQELFPNADAVEFYGATELSLVSVLHGHEDGPMESVGRPVAGVEVSVRAPYGTEVGRGEPGHVHVRSDMLFTRYLSAADTARPDPDGWFTVGDVGRLDEDGYLHLVGRARGMLISGGVNVYPEEVEAALVRLDEIAEAAVVGLPDNYWGDLVCAVVRWRPGVRMGLAPLRTALSTHLSRQKCPRRLFEKDVLPHTPSGKIDRRLVRSLLIDGDDTIREMH